MRPDEKILYVLELVETARQLAPKSEHCFVDHKAIDKKKLSEIELHSILKKLEKDDNVLEIVDGPFESGVAVWGDNTPRTFKLNVLGSFDNYYNEQYELSRFGIKNLSHQNYYRVYSVAQEIQQELNIIKGNKVDIEATKTTPMMWKGINQKSISLYDIKQIKTKALNFLRDVEAIDTFQLIDSKKTDQAFRITVTRRKFDEAFLELILNSPNRKSSSLIKKLLIDKQPKPKIEKPDDTIFEPSEEPIADEPINATMPQNKEKVRFDAKASKLTFNSKTCDIPDETLEHYICKLVFKNRRVAAKEDDILEYTTKSQESQRAVYDAMLRINKKANNHLGTPKLLSYKAAKVRLTAKYQ